jgi:hypothetical protein
LAAPAFSAGNEQPGDGFAFQSFPENAGDRAVAKAGQGLGFAGDVFVASEGALAGPYVADVLARKQAEKILANSTYASQLEQLVNRRAYIADTQKDWISVEKSAAYNQWTHIPESTPIGRNYLVTADRAATRADAIDDEIDGIDDQIYGMLDNLVKENPALKVRVVAFRTALKVGTYGVIAAAAADLGLRVYGWSNGENAGLLPVAAVPRAAYHAATGIFASGSKEDTDLLTQFKRSGCSIERDDFDNFKNELARKSISEKAFFAQFSSPNCDLTGSLNRARAAIVSRGSRLNASEVGIEPAVNAHAASGGDALKTIAPFAADSAPADRTNHRVINQDLE